MSIPRYRTTATVNASSVGGKVNLTAEVSVAASTKLQALAKARNITRGGLAREILTRIAERPDLLETVLREGA